MNIWTFYPHITIDGDTYYFTCENSLIKGGDLIIAHTWYNQLENRFVGKIYEVNYVEYSKDGLSSNVVYVSAKNDAMFQGELC